MSCSVKFVEGRGWGLLSAAVLAVIACPICHGGIRDRAVVATSRLVNA
jgi:hypothetical protein